VVALSHDPGFDPYGSAFAANPYPIYRALRSKHPIFYSDKLGMLVFTRYRDIAEITTDRRFGRAPTQTTVSPFSDLPHFDRYVARNMLEMEGAKHQQLRTLVAPYFMPDRVQLLEQRVRKLTSQILDNLAPQRCMEFLEDVAIPIPVTVIADLLGVEEDARGQLRQWADATVRIYEHDHNQEDRHAAEQAVTAFADVLKQMIAHRRKSATDDFLSFLINAQRSAPTLTDDDVIATAMMVLNAGHEATVNASGNGLWALLNHPDQAATVRTSSLDAAKLVEEVLRYDAPLHFFHRYVLEDMTFADHKLRAGDRVGLLYGSANRDEEAFDAPEDFNIERHPNPHLSFGKGTHFCLGAHLARLELQIILPEMVKRFSTLEPALDVPDYHQGLVFRGMRRLPLIW